MDSVYAAGFIWRFESLHGFRKKNTRDRNNSLEQASTRAHLSMGCCTFFSYTDLNESMQSEVCTREKTGGCWQYDRERDIWQGRVQAGWCWATICQSFSSLHCGFSMIASYSPNLFVAQSQVRSLFLWVSLIFHLSFLSVCHPVL